MRYNSNVPKRILSHNQTRGGTANEKTGVTRKQRRDALESFKLSVELWKIIRQFFPDLIPLLREVLDVRHPSYIRYKHYVLLLVRTLASVFRIRSMRRLSEDLNSTKCIENFGRILGLDEELTELPHWKTINDYLERLDPTEPEKIIPRHI